MSETGAPAESITAGGLLRDAREAAGLHAATLAATLKVPLRKLEALEEDRYDLLGDSVFVRALASSICRTLKMDPQPVLERLPQTAQPRLLPAKEGINAPFRAPGDGPGPGMLDQVSRPVVITVAALLLGALVLIFLPVVQSAFETVAEANKGDPVMPPPAAATPVPGGLEISPSASMAELPASASGVAPTAPAVTQAPDASVAPATGVPTPRASASASGASALTMATSLPAPRPVASAPGAAAAPQAAAPASPAAATQPAASAAMAAASGPINARGVVAFRTSAPSWIQVTDATGATVFRRLMEPGETAGATGTLPLSVTVGSVEATEVQVRGKPYNLQPVSRDNVARFEVK